MTVIETEIGAAEKSSAGVVNEKVSSSTQRIPKTGGVIRAHYYRNSSTVLHTAVILGVGTAMRVESYDFLSQEIVNELPDAVVIILDPAPGRMMKKNAAVFAKHVLYLQEHLSELVPICKHPPSTLLVGGHSAGGMAAFEALAAGSLVTTAVTGFVGLDPYFSPVCSQTVTVPTLSWGFATTMYKVHTNRAVAKAYELSTDRRVLYQVQNDPHQLTHCGFTHKGCFGAVCPIHNETVAATLRKAVTISIRVFLRAAQTDSFVKKQFVLSEVPALQMQLFVNQDQVQPGHVSAVAVAMTT
jgi:hypothetical protein